MATQISCPQWCVIPSLECDRALPLFFIVLSWAGLSRAHTDYPAALAYCADQQQTCPRLQTV